MISLDQICLSKGRGENQKEILKSVSLEVNKGDIYTILGPSGSGKSTLLRTINRMIDPDSGRIFVENKDILDMPIIELRRKIGMVFQRPMLFAGTVEENILYGPKIHKVVVDALEYLEMVGLERELIKREVATLSGGQQQRVALARSLANKPEVLLLDEPTSALDIRATEQLEELMTGLVNRLELTVLWVTHNVEQAKRVGSKTMLLVDGQVVESQATRMFFANPSNQLTLDFLAGKLEMGRFEK